MPVVLTFTILFTLNKHNTNTNKHIKFHSYKPKLQLLLLKLL